MGVLEFQVDLCSKCVDLFGHDGSDFFQSCNFSFVLDGLQFLSAESGSELASLCLDVLLACIEPVLVLFDV